MKTHTAVGASLAPLPILLVALAVLGLMAEHSAAQDIEAASELGGIPLPAAYYSIMAADPGFFEFPESGWSRRARAIADANQIVDPLSGNLPVGGPLEVDALTGSLPLLVIPALFSDSSEPFISSTDIDGTLFGGSLEQNLTGFYLEASGGRMSVVGQVAPWVRTSLTMAETVGTSDGLGGDSRTGEYLVEALVLSDPSVDFRLFDSDGPDGIPNSGDDDGIVDAVAFEFLEVGASCGGPAIWPHRSSIRSRTGSRYDSQDMGFDGTPIQVSGYIVQGVTECDGVQLQAPNVIAHELGHTFGLPDLYHPIDSREPEGRRWVVGCWGLMAAGSWGCGDPTEKTPGYGPIHMSPWSRNRLGWLEYIPVGVGMDQEFWLDPSISTERALRIPLSPETDEVLVLEYRPRAGFDAALPAGGILAYRENPGGTRRPARGSGIPYSVYLLEADGRTDLLRTYPNGGNRGEASDAFATMGREDRLSNLTIPSLHLSSGPPSTVSVDAMSVVGGRAHIRITTLPAPIAILDAPPPPWQALNPIDWELRIAGGALPYRVVVESGAIPLGLSLEVRVDRVALSGLAREAGTFAPVLRVTDARGNATSVPLSLSLEDVTVTIDAVAAQVLGSPEASVDDDTAAFLDRAGNENGELDVGDLRARLFGGGSE